MKFVTNRPLRRPGKSEGVIQRQGDGFPLDRSPRCLPAILASREEAVTAGQPASNQIRRKRSMSSAASAAILTSGLRPALPSVNLDYQTVHVLIAISHLRESLRGHPPLTVSVAVGSKPSCCIEYSNSLYPRGAYQSFY